MLPDVCRLAVNNFEVLRCGRVSPFGARVDPHSCLRAPKRMIVILIISIMLGQWRLSKTRRRDCKGYQSPCRMRFGLSQLKSDFHSVTERRHATWGGGTRAGLFSRLG